MFSSRHVCRLRISWEGKFKIAQPWLLYCVFPRQLMERLLHLCCHHHMFKLGCGDTLQSWTVSIAIHCLTLGECNPSAHILSHVCANWLCRQWHTSDECENERLCTNRRGGERDRSWNDHWRCSLSWLGQVKRSWAECSSIKWGWVGGSLNNLSQQPHFSPKMVLCHYRALE